VSGVGRGVFEFRRGGIHGDVSIMAGVPGSHEKTGAIPLKKPKSREVNGLDVRAAFRGPLEGRRTNPACRAFTLAAGCDP
jgi:hypothetical protein